jgi:hypothetical protein
MPLTSAAASFSQRGLRATMRHFILTLVLVVFANPALADKQQDEFDKRNVYDVFGELTPKPSSGVTLEEDVTSRIKRYMASLLYD